MADLINTDSASSEEVSKESKETVDNNSKFLGYKNSCNFRKATTKEKLKAHLNKVYSFKDERTDNEYENMVEENRNDQVDSFVFKDSNEEDHNANENEINISKTEEKLIDNTNCEEKNATNIRIVENEDDFETVKNDKIMSLEGDHNNDENTNETIENDKNLVKDENNKDDKEESSSQTKNEDDSKVKVETQDPASTINDMELDDDCCFVQRAPTLKELADSDYIHYRQLAARKIFEALKQARSNEKELHSIIAIMCKLSEDEEVMVRLELLNAIPAIAVYFQDDLFVKIVIRQQLIPYTVKLLSDLQPQIRKSGQSALLNLLENDLIDQSQLTEWICPLIVQMAKCETNPVEVIVEDISLMTKMIPIVGREITLKFFLEPYITLSTRHASEVRKICALGFGNLCCVVEEETSESSLLPVFLKLCDDEIWEVRKACTEVFVDVAKSVSLEARKGRLLEVFLNFVSDISSCVRFGAYQNMGGYIHTFAVSHDCVSAPYSQSESVDNTNLNTQVSSDANLNIESSKPENTTELKVNSSQNDPQQKELIPTTEPVTACEPSSLSSRKIRKARRSSLAVAAKDGHVYLHVNNENLFNNFQFWRLPLPEVELDVDIEPGKATNIHIRAKVQGIEEEPASEIKVSISPEQSDTDSSSLTNMSSTKKMLVQTACINKFITRDEHSLLDDSEIMQSSFNETILAFKDDTEPCIVPEDDDTSKLDYGKFVDTLTSLCLDPRKSKQMEYKISAFDQDIVPPQLLLAFISPVHHYRFSEVVKKYDDEVMGYIAYSFPAVAVTLGPKYWPCIKDTCEVLARDMKWNIRRTMASLLPELASILGKEIIMTDLVPIFTDLLKDVDEVRLRVIQRLSDFLKHLTPHDRKQFLPFFGGFTIVDSEKNWRYRFALAEELKRTAELYDAEEVFEYFLPIASSLLQDRISAVRLAAIQLTAYLLKRLYQDSRTEYTLKTMLDSLDSSYRLSPTWSSRQTYVRLCEELAKQESLSMEKYVEIIIPKLFSLAWDAVPNIRLGVMRCIVETLLPMGMLPLLESNNSSQELLHKVLEWTKYDTDNDVRHFAILYNEVSQRFSSP